MFGRHFAQTIQELKKYVIKYGEQTLSPYFNTIHWEQDANGNISLSKVELRSEQPDDFIAGFNDLYNVELAKEVFQSSDAKDSIINYIYQLHASTIKSGNVGDYHELHFCLYIPLYEPELWEQAKTLTNWIKSLNLPTHIDMAGFTADLANVICPDDESKAQKRNDREQQTKKIIHEIVKYREENQGNIYHFLVMQNMQTGGISLDLSSDSFIRVVGEFAMMCVENYQSVFGIAPPESDLQSFGLSVLQFDKYYFIEYLLHKAYLFSMEREGVHEEEIDINMAFNKSKIILKDRIHLLSEFFKKEVLPRLERKQDEAHMVEELAPLLIDKLNEIESDCDAFINDKSLSISAKRAILTAILGYDDELFVNTIFDDNTLIFDDLDTEAMNVFIAANNTLLVSTKENEEFIEEMANQAILSKDNQPVVHPLNKMKKLHTEMQRRMGYIRELEEDMKRIETQIGNISESKKCLIEDGFFVIGENKYRLLPPVIEEPLKETYTAHATNIQSVDLRNYFNNIKNQGQQGSCLAFALTSIYEYILKNNDVKEIDLSEAFLYYNVRKKAGEENEDKDSRLLCAIDSLAEYGICMEKLCEYNENIFNIKPCEEAYTDALQRRVKKALNVNGTVDDIKSALSDGYPVAVSLNIYPSFGNNSLGFVSLPTDEEISNADLNSNYSHAMVITGYDDDKKLFVIRNSWGTGFGDNGYCYIPYSYITHDKLFHWACIIKEVDVYSAAAARKTKSMLKFDETDTNIRIAIIKNLISEEKLLLKANENDYKLLRLDYELLKQSLKNPNSQSKLRQSTKKRISKEIEKLEHQRENVKQEKYTQLDEFDKHTRKTGIKISLIAVSIVAFVFIMANVVGSIVQKQARYRAEKEANEFVQNYVDSVRQSVSGYPVSDTAGLMQSNSQTANSEIPIFNEEDIKSVAGKLAQEIEKQYLKEHRKKIFKYKLYACLSAVVLVSFLFIYFPYRKKKRKMLEQEFDDELENLAVRKAGKEQELAHTSLKMHIAGHLLTKLFELQSAITAKHDAASSFLANLKTWYLEEKETVKSLNANTQLPFISLLNNNVLDKFFDTNKNSITKQISLCENIVDFSKHIKNKTINKDDLIRYKNNIKTQCVDKLKSLIDGFNIYSALCNPDRFDYLDINQAFMTEILPKLDEKSCIFLYDNGTQGINPSKFIMINTPTDDDTRQWENFYPKYFTEKPNAKTFLSPYKVMIFQLADLSLQQIS
jgi:C1A family cysteine protease